MTLKENNLIQQAAAEKKELPAVKSPTNRMREVLNMKASQSMMADILKENKEAFVASLLEIYGSDNTLAKCDPGEVLKEGFKAVSYNLPLNKGLGYAYIIPYKDKFGVQHPQFQIGYKGYIQLAVRTNQYADMHMDNVYEGELQSMDRMSGKPLLDESERTGDKVIGYFAMFETIHGFKKVLYWSMEKTLQHIQKYSKSYQQGAAIWKTNFNEMAQKTVMRNLLSRWGIMTVNANAVRMQEAINHDVMSDLPDDIVVTDGTVTDTETGEITPAAGTVE